MIKKRYILLVVVIIIIIAISIPKNTWEVIDLRESWPEGTFQQASIVELNHEGDVQHTYLTIPVGKIDEFQKALVLHVMKAKEEAKNPELATHLWEAKQLRIVTDKGKYAIPFVWTDEYVHFNGLKSKDFRQVLFAMGLKSLGKSI
jgi:hypothetical protein